MPISVDPNPAQAGKPADVCYSPWSGISSTVITITWKPSTIPPTVIELTPGAPCATITVPTGATAGTAIDAQDIQPDLSFFVES